MKSDGASLTTEEQLFCTRYEVGILSGIVTEGKLERWVPGFCGTQTHKEHVARYEWICPFIRDKIVLDIACGAGFGSAIMAASGAAKVIGVDNDADTIRYASLKNRLPNLFFEEKDAGSFDAREEFDVIASFETIEHLSQPGSFLKNVNSALKGNGTCFISSPISPVDENRTPDNVYHKFEWGFKRFREMVSAHLRVENIYLQLYKGERSGPGFLVRALQKSGFRQSNEIPVERLTPHKWDPKEIKEEQLGSDWTGYQIVQCSKITDAGS